MVYYLNEEEIKDAERLSREVDVDEEFRGWNYKEGPLRPPYNVKIPLYIISNNLTFNSRAEYEELRRVNKSNPTKEMVLGSLIHRILFIIVGESKRFIYKNKNTTGNELYAYLIDIKEACINNLINSLEGVAKVHATNSIHYLNRLWYYEALQIAANLDRINSQGNYSIDILIEKAIPFTLEYVVDGSKIGLSEELRIDAFGRLVIFELKTGIKQEHHKLALAGYALALESTLEHPINVGCLVYLSFNNEDAIPRIKREVYAIEESLRRWFIEERDKRLEILANT